MKETDDRRGCFRRRLNVEDAQDRRDSGKSSDGNQREGGGKWQEMRSVAKEKRKGKWAPTLGSSLKPCWFCPEG